MGALANWLTSLFVSLATYFGAWFTKRAAFIAAGLTTFAGMVASIYGAMAALVGGMSAAFPNGGLIATGVWLFVPDNTAVCLSAMIAADVALSLFFWQFVNLKMAMQGAN
jgi:hypothetical protein